MRLFNLCESTWRHVTGGHGPGEPQPIEIIEAPSVMFHGTSSVWLDQIMDQGLLAGNCVTGKMDLARFSARRAVQRFGGEPIILTLDIGSAGVTLYGTLLDSVVEGVVLPEFIKFRRYKPRS